MQNNGNPQTAYQILVGHSWSFLKQIRQAGVRRGCCKHPYCLTCVLPGKN